MASGEDFIDALSAAVAPATIVNIKGDSTGVRIALSDNSVIEAKRKRIADLKTVADLNAYVVQVMS